MVLDLTRAESIQINNKEVKQLKIGDVVIWEKLSIENLILSANKDAVTTGDTVILSAQLADANHDPIAKIGKTIDFCNVLFSADYDTTVDINSGAYRTMLDTYYGGIDDNVYVELNLSGGWGSNSQIKFYDYDDNSPCSDDADNVTFGEIDFTNGLLRLEKDDSTVKIYVNGVLKLTKTLQYYDWKDLGIVPDIAGTKMNSVEVGELIGSVNTNETGLANVSYLVEDSQDLNIKAKYTSISSNETHINQYLFNPALNGTTNVMKYYDSGYSQTDGVITGKGFLFLDGWDNTGLWQLDMEVKHTNIQYEGICFVREISTVKTGYVGVTTWEGSWMSKGTPEGVISNASPSSTSRYATYSSGAIDWFDVHVRKTSPTHLLIWSEDKKLSYELEWSSLAELSRVTCGINHHSSSSSYGPSSIRNITVKSL